MDTLLFSISGLRGIVGQGLYPEDILRYTLSFARTVPRGPIVVGRDSRPSGEMVQSLVEGALLAAGRDVIPLGICPTPTIQWAVASLRAPGGIAVTASHNPIQWNALKFMGADGIFLNAVQARRLETRAKGRDLLRQTGRRTGHRVPADSIGTGFIDAILQLPQVAPARIRRRRWTVALDCVNGAGSVLFPELLERLGCRVSTVHSTPSGDFARGPEPVPAHLQDLSRLVTRSHADIGFAVDPDGDRLALVDETGRPIGEDYTLALAAQHVAPAPALVTTLSTTRLLDDIGNASGFRVVRTKVGEAHVVQRMRRSRITLGGEGNGGVILGDFHYGRDAAVGMALVLQLLTDTKQSLSTIVGSLPRYVMVKEKMSMPPARYRRAVRDIRAHWRVSASKISLLDGIRVDMPESWFHVRPSNTEPIVRIYAEAGSKSASRALVREVRSVMS